MSSLQDLRKLLPSKKINNHNLSLILCIYFSPEPICLSTYTVYAIFVSLCAVKREWERERRGVREKEKERGIKRRQESLPNSVWQKLCCLTICAESRLCTCSE